jgi:hypothetical protein
VAYDSFSFENHPLSGKGAELINMGSASRVLPFAKSPTYIGI